MKRVSLAVFCLIFATSLFAKDLTVKLTVSRMQAIQEQERKGDQLYFDIAEYSAQGLQQFYRVPEKPIHLLSRYLHKVKNFNLWRSTLKEGQDALVIVSLIEEDHSPWDLDDLIGVVKLRMKNEGGKLITFWSMPNTVNEGIVLENKQGDHRRFNLTEDKAKYQLDLLLTSQ